MFWTVFACVACFSLVSTLQLVIAAIWLRREARRALSNLEETVHAFVTAPDETTPAPVASYIDLVSTMLVTRAVQQVKAMASGVLSGEAKREKDGVVAESLAAAPPWLGLAATFLPKKVVRQVMSNPQMLGMLGNFGGARKGNHNGDTAATTSVIQDRLKRQQ